MASPIDRTVTIVIKPSTVIHPPVEIQVLFDARADSTLSNIPLLAKTRLEQVFDQTPVSIDPCAGEMLLEPDYPLDTKFWDLPANETTLTAYVPLKIDALSNNARSASLEIETIQETLKALQERMKSSERREQEAKEEREKEKQDSERRELERKEEREKEKQDSERRELERKEEREKEKQDSERRELERKEERKRAKKERKEENREQRRELEASERRHSEKQEKSEKRINALEDQLEESQSQSSAFKLQLEEVQSQSNDTASYIAVGDRKALYRIRVRKLLDLGQAKLARAAGLTSDTSKNGSLKWRDALSKGGAENRLQSAVNHLELTGQISQATRDVMRSLLAMRLMTEMSSIRIAGDSFAQDQDVRSLFEEAVGWHDVVEEREGLNDIITYIFAES